MTLKKIETDFPGVFVIEPAVYSDNRGYFLELWNRNHYHQLGLREEFVQDNLSFSKKGVLRGLHFQYPDTQGKLVYVLEGEVFDVAVDIRKNSPTFGKYISVNLSGSNKRQLYIPPGFAHGFCVVSESAMFGYKCTQLFNPSAEKTLIWNDPEVGIEWPVEHPLLSTKDGAGLSLHEFAGDLLPRV